MIDPNDDFIPTQWMPRACFDDPESDQITIDKTSGFYGVGYAVRCRGRCLNVKGKWEFEPQPSSRSNAFLKRCRFKTLDAAMDAARKARLA